MENDILFSIIIPTYNNADLIERCLDSIIAQTYTNWEAIIINNYSTDNTVEVVNSYNEKRFKLINFSNNGIIAASRNRGLKEASGEWIAFLDSDDWWTPNKLAKCYLYTEKADFIYHPLLVKTAVDAFSSSLKSKGRALNKNCLKDLLINGNAIPNSGALVKNSVVREIGYISEDSAFFACEDYDFWIRIAEVTERFSFINENLGFYWIGNNTSSSVNMRNKEKLIFEKFKKHLSEDEYSFLSYRWMYKNGRDFQRNGLYDNARNVFRDVIGRHKYDTFYFRSVLFNMLSFFKIRM